MTRIVQSTGRARSAVTAAMSAGILSIAACGAVPTEAEQIESQTSAITANSMQTLLDALTNNPNGSILLTTNLNASGFVWHLGYFAGTFDGGNHTISNFTTSDTIGQAAGMFVYAEHATLKNVKLTNVRVTGTYDVGGLVGDCLDCTISNVGVEGTLNAPMYAGGIAGALDGGSLTRSYFKGTATGGSMGAGGLVGLTSPGDTGIVAITVSYAQAPTATGTLAAASTATGTHPAGGIVGGGEGAQLADVYAVGNVSGRGSVGGLIGQSTCDSGTSWLLHRSIYRGNVTDSNLTPAQGGWAGTIGKAADFSCNVRIAGLFFNREMDTSTNFLNIDQRPSTTLELQRPVAANGGIFCLPDVIPSRCGDNGYTNPPWDPGTSAQYHALLNVQGGLSAQPR